MTTPDPRGHSAAAHDTKRSQMRYIPTDSGNFLEAAPSTFSSPTPHAHRSPWNSPMTSDEEDAPPTPAFTTSQPTPARIYDALLGGKDNYAADRDAAARALQREPNSRVIVRANREFLRRVVTYLVEEAGIRQIIDLGSGLPEQDNVHHVA